MPDARRRFEALLLPVREGLYRFALQLTGDAVSADDLLQQTSVAALTHFHQLDAEPAFRAWMSRIMYRTHLNHRKSAASLHDARSEPLDDRVASTPSPAEGPERRADRRRIADRIAEALQGLRPDQARAIWLVDGQGFSFREAAEILELPRGTVATLVARGRRALAPRLADVALEQGVIR